MIVISYVYIYLNSFISVMSLSLVDTKLVIKMKVAGDLDLWTLLQANANKIITSIQCKLTFPLLTNIEQIT